MRLLDLFCGAGGAAMGYHRAGWEVVGVDIKPQPHYPFPFVQADALTFDLSGYDAIHASPPCQAFTHARHIQKRSHPDLLAPIRARLTAQRAPWVIENVGEAPMPHFLRLCGTHFGLHVYRHRQFESSELLMSPGGCRHPVALLPGYFCIVGGKAKGHQTSNRGNRFERCDPALARKAMGIDWMSLDELCQAIPPAYTEWIGRQLLAAAQAA